MAAGGTLGKRLSPGAWDALTEALSVFWWYKSGLSQFLHAELREAPELLAGLDFSQPKRAVVSQLIAELRRREDRYQATVIELLTLLAAFDERFPHLARLDDGPIKMAAAVDALREVKIVIEAHGELATAHERIQRDTQDAREREHDRQQHESMLSTLRQEYMEMYAMTDHQYRGKLFEHLLNTLFDLFDLYPRAAYNLQHEQIDGAFTFQTDDYLLEARWWNTPLEPKHLNEFKGKVDSKAKHTLGLLVAVGGFTEGAIKLHSSGTPLILMTGTDLFAVLDNRISLLEMLERKRRHAAETGSPMLHIGEMTS